MTNGNNANLASLLKARSLKKEKRPHLIKVLKRLLEERSLQQARRIDMMIQVLINGLPQKIMGRTPHDIFID